MKHTIEKPEFAPYLTTYESELQYMADLAEKRGNIETGGEVYGLKSHAGRLILMLATGPGPKAIYEKAHFQQDANFLKKTNAVLSREFGIQYAGNWHHHHCLFGELSSRDIQSTRSTAQKNGYIRLGQILLNFENRAPISSTYRDQRTSAMARDHSPKNRYATSENSNEVFEQTNIEERQNVSIISEEKRIKIQSFFYFDAMEGDPVKCPIKVLPGLSPIRRALIEKPETYMFSKKPEFPLSRISFESYQPPKKPTDSMNQLPETILKQISDLPDTVLNNMSYILKEDFLIVSLPLPGEQHTLYIAFQIESPHQPKYVYLSSNRFDEDQTKAIEGSLIPEKLGKLSLYTRTVLEFVNRTLSMIL